MGSSLKGHVWGLNLEPAKFITELLTEINANGEGV